MDAIFFIIVGIFFILLVYACSPYIISKIHLHIQTKIITLEKVESKEIDESKPWAVLEFMKKFVLYEFQPFFHFIYDAFK
jgi:hypothetical protein